MAELDSTHVANHLRYDAVISSKKIYSRHRLMMIDRSLKVEHPQNTKGNQSHLILWLNPPKKQRKKQMRKKIYLNDAGASQLLHHHQAVQLILRLVSVRLDAPHVLYFRALDCVHENVQLPLELGPQRLLSTTGRQKQTRPRGETNERTR